MEFSAQISMANAAFDDAPASELARILRDIARRIEAGDSSGIAFDANGNRAGQWSVTGEKEAH